MKIRLKKGKQTELILFAKGDKTWDELSKILGVGSSYLSHELRQEIRLLSKEVYLKLSNLVNVNFNKYIIEELEDNWGQVDGGKKSNGSLKEIKIPKRNEKLAEVIGAILGDGNVNFYKKDKKIGTYQVKISGHYLLDKEYHMVYLKELFKELFGLDGKEIIPRDKHERFLSISSKKLVEFFIKDGLLSGDKIKNQVTIPKWIFEDERYLKACIRGLIDTDGSIYRMSNQDPNLLRINFTNLNLTLLNDTRQAFIRLGFNPSKIVRNKYFQISRKNEINKYLKEVGFSNKKHKDRLCVFTSPVV